MNTQFHKYLIYLIYFFIGGTLLVMLHYIAININSTAAAFLWSFPILSLPAYLLIYYETQNRRLVYDMNSDVIIFFFVNLSFFLLLYCFLKHTKISVYKSMIYALSIFSIIGLATYYTIRRLKI